MAALSIELLGGLNVQLHGRPLTNLKSRKAEALLIYLACQQRPFSRDYLAGFFWDSSERAQAQANLRKLLSGLRQAVGDFLLIDRDSVAFHGAGDYWLDVAAFQALAKETSGAHQSAAPAEQDQREQAMILYKGDFLAGFYLRDSLAFEEWAALERERLRLTAITLLTQLATLCLHRRRHQKGIVHATHLLALDPLNEHSHRLLMRLLVRDGQRHAALAQYGGCQRILAEELGVPPTAETTAVYERIRHAPERPYHFPAHASVILGREEELAQLYACLEKGEHPVLTLIGPGGVGKTRLALAAAADLSGDYRHGVYLVQLAGFAPAAGRPARAQLVAALANTLNVSFSGSHSSEQQLLDYLREKEMLVVLDNFEQFLEASDLLQSIQRQATAVTCLVTCRQPLHLPGEWVLELTGLPLPNSNRTLESIHGSQFTAPETYPALQLFQQQARRVQADFALTPENYQDVIRLCRLVDGLPLGIELAAAASRAFTPVQIARQLQNNLDFLAGGARDLPARHRSARAIFEYAWELLNPRERAQFSRLTIFHGRFNLHAAMAVAQIPPATLTALADKSMLHMGESEYYQIHELLRQYGREKLQQEPAAYKAVVITHGRYYGALLQDQATNLYGPDQAAILETIRANLDNVLAAWQWAVDCPEPAVLRQMAEALFLFYARHGRYQEALALLQPAIHRLQMAALPETAVTLTILLIHQSNLLVQLSRYDEAAACLNRAHALAEANGLPAQAATAYLHSGHLAAVTSQHAAAQEHYEEARRRYHQLDDLHGAANALDRLGRLHFRLSDFPQAQTCFEQCLAMQRALNDHGGIADALTGLATVIHYHAGNYTAAQEMYREALEMKRALGDRMGITVSLNLLANLACNMEDWSLAAAYYEESLAICRETGAPLRTAVTLGNLGTVYHEWQQYDTARAMYEESVAISRRIGDEVGVAFCLANLAGLAYQSGYYERALAQWQEVLALGCRLQLNDRILYALVGLAELWNDARAPVYEPAQAQRLLHYVFHHPTTNQGIRDKISRISPTLPTLSLSEPETRPLAEVAADVLAR